jgi:hypothetical protein
MRTARRAVIWCRSQVTNAQTGAGPARLRAVFARAESAEADFVGGAGVAAGAAVRRVTSQIDADVVAIDESALAAVLACTHAGEADFTCAADVAAETAVGGVGLRVDADVVAECQTGVAGPFSHEETVPLGAAGNETGLPWRTDVAARTAIVDVVLQIEADTAAVGGAGWTDHRRRGGYLWGRCLSGHCGWRFGRS